MFIVALQYPFNVFVLFNTVFNLNLNLNKKKRPKNAYFKNLEKIWKNEWQPCILLSTIVILKFGFKQK